MIQYFLFSDINYIKNKVDWNYSSWTGMPDQNFENQGFLIENQDFIRIFFFQKQEENQEFFFWSSENIYQLVKR